MRPTLFVSDLDGTLLRDDRTLSRFARETLNRLVFEGILFTVASARSISSIRPILDGLNLRLPVIEFNGAHLTEFAGGRHLATSAIERDVVNACFDAILDAGGKPFISTVSSGVDLLVYDAVVNEGMQWYVVDRSAAHDPRLRMVPDVRGFLGDDLVCFTVIEREPVAHAIRDAVAATGGEKVVTDLSAHRYSPEWWWLTVHSSEARKDRAIARLIEYCGLGDVRVVAFGDDVNDEAMLAAADTGVAVANAHPSVKGAADRVIGSNEGDAVVRFIAETWEGIRGFTRPG